MDDGLRSRRTWSKEGPFNMEASQERSRVHLIIRGMVQGVYFRASTAEEARNLGITGWVMNRNDGSVEVTAEGDRAKLENFIAWCRHGPRGAYVHQVQLEWQPFQNEFQGFRIKR